MLFQRDCPTDRTVSHYYYQTWPDRGTPKNPSSLCAFTEHVRQHLESIPRLGPAVVHCRSDLCLGPRASCLNRGCRCSLKSTLCFWSLSAGVGRSGTFVTLLWLMQLCVRGIQPEVRAAVEDLRLHRMWMVQTLVSTALRLEVLRLLLPGQHNRNTKYSL